MTISNRTNPPASITQLPSEVVTKIIDKAAGTGDRLQATAPAQPLTRAQAARLAKRACAFPHLSKYFQEVHQAWLNAHPNAEIGYAASKNAFRNFCKLGDNEEFKKYVNDLIAKTTHLEFDLRALPLERLEIVLDALESLAKSGKELRPIRLSLDLDQLDTADKALDTLRATSAIDGEPSCELHSSTRNRDRTTFPDFRRYPELKSVDLTGCFNLTAPPDFSGNPHLSEVNLSSCISLITAPDFSANPNLAKVSLRACSGLIVTPDFSGNPNLTDVNLRKCTGLTVTPDFSCSPNLVKVNLANCTSLTEAPDFTRNPHLREVDLSNCSGLTTPPDFTHLAKLTHVYLSECTSLNVTPDFTGNPELAEVYLDGCSSLTATPDFSHNPKLRSLDLKGCSGLTVRPDFSLNPDLSNPQLDGALL